MAGKGAAAKKSPGGKAGGSGGKAGVARAADPKPAPLAGRLAASWEARLGAGALCALVAFMAAGVPYTAFGWLARGAVAGLCAGLAVRAKREIPFAAGLAALAALIGGQLGSVLRGPASASPTPPFGVSLTAMLVAAAVAALVALLAEGTPRLAGVAALAVVLLLFTYVVGLVPGTAPATAGDQFRTALAMEPPAGQYGFDGYLLLRVNFLMDQGMSYYPAFIKAHKEDSRLKGLEPRMFVHIRQPWLHQVWNALPGRPGVKVWYWFVVMTLVTMSIAFALARRYVGPAAALIAPVMIGGYFAMPAQSLWFPLSEFWAGCVAVWFLYALVNERWTAAGVLAVVAFAFRELLAILVPVLLLVIVLSPRRREALLGAAIAVAGPPALFWLHYLWSPIKNQTSENTAFYLNGGIKTLLADLRFSGDMTLGSHWLYVAVPVAALVGALLVRRAPMRFTLAGAALAPVVLFSAFSSGGEWGYYWGAIAMPLLFALVPLAAGRVLPSALGVFDARPTPLKTPGKMRVVLYARDVEASLEATVASLREALSAAGREAAILVAVDTDSTDGTAKAAGSLKAAEGLTVLRGERGAGRDALVGKAVTAAARASKDADSVVVLDACTGLDLSVLSRLAERHDEGHDVVVASRLAPRARSAASLPLRLARGAMCRVASAVMRSLSPVPGLRDYSAPAMLLGGRFLRRAAAEGVDPAEGLAFVPDGVGLGRVTEVPVRAGDECEPRCWGAGFGSLGALLRGRGRILLRGWA